MNSNDKIQQSFRLIDREGITAFGTGMIQRTDFRGTLGINFGKFTFLFDEISTARDFATYTTVRRYLRKRYLRKFTSALDLPFDSDYD
jgi:hypothetical protein